MVRFFFLILALPVWLFGLPWESSTPEPTPVVRAVLFYSPTCGHCEKVINQDLPPIFRKYPTQLEMVGVDVSNPENQALYAAALQHYQRQVGGVPFLVVGRHALMGSVEIPEQFPILIEAYLAEGGVDWPNVPGMAEYIQKVVPTVTPTPYMTRTPRPDYTPVPLGPEAPKPGMVMEATSQLSAWEKMLRDPLGNGLAIVTLLGMLAVAVGAVIHFSRLEITSQPAWQVLIVPLLCLVGFGVAGYLAYVETAQVTAVCGPVGDCNTVQQSEYAHLFGILPIGVLGLAGYIAIILAWTVSQMKREPISSYAALAVLAMTAFGLLFSIYLTFLEPFVIGATCAWCLTSAILMTALFWLSLKPGKRAWGTFFPA